MHTKYKKKNECYITKSCRITGNFDFSLCIWVCECLDFLSPGSYVLSVLDYSPERGPSCKHYKIRNMDNSTGYYIATRRVLPTLPDLINHYKGNNGGSHHASFSLSVGNYVLSVRDHEQTKGNTVRHYKIRNMDNSAGYYIAARRVMPSLPDLISHYSGNLLCCLQSVRPVLSSIAEVIL